MQSLNSGVNTPMGRDPDLKWAQWLIQARRVNSHSTSITNASPQLNSTRPPSPPSFPSPPLDHGYHHVRSRSSATNYFTLLSAAEEANQQNGRLAQHPQKYPLTGNFAARSGQYMDSLWAVWLAEQRSHQGPLQESDIITLESQYPSATPLPTQMNHSSPYVQPLSVASYSSSPQSTNNVSPVLGKNTCYPSASSTVSVAPGEPDDQDPFTMTLESTFPSNLSMPTIDLANSHLTTDGLDSGFMSWLHGNNGSSMDLIEEQGQQQHMPRKRYREGDFCDSQMGIALQSSFEGFGSKKMKTSHFWTDQSEESSPVLSNDPLVGAMMPF